MKWFSLSLTAAVLSAALLAGCGNTSSPSVSGTAGSAPASSSSTVASSPASAPASSDVTTPSFDIDFILTTLSEAAGLGDGTVAFAKEDLLGQSDVADADIVAMAGAQSNMYQENGGLVIVIQATPGKAEAVKTELENFRDGILAVNANYASEFPSAYANLSQAVTTIHDDCVIFVSAANGEDGGYETVDAALKTVFE